MKVHGNAMRNHENPSRPMKTHSIVTTGPVTVNGPHFMVNHEGSCRMPMEVHGNFMVVSGEP